MEDRIRFIRDFIDNTEPLNSVGFNLYLLDENDRINITNDIISLEEIYGPYVNCEVVDYDSYKKLKLRFVRGSIHINISSHPDCCGLDNLSGFSCRNISDNIVSLTFNILKKAMSECNSISYITSDEQTVLNDYFTNNSDWKKIHEWHNRNSGNNLYYWLFDYNKV